MCMDVSLACMYVCVPCACYPWRSEEVIRASGTGVRDCYNSLCGRCEPNLCSLKEYQVLLNTEPFSSPPNPICIEQVNIYGAYSALNQKTISRQLEIDILLKFFSLFQIICMYGYVPKNVHAHRDQKRQLEPLELELQVVTCN